MSDTIVMKLPYSVDLNKTIEKTALSTLFASDDNLAHRFELTLCRGDSAVEIGGLGVVGYFIRYSDRTTVPLKGSIEGGKVVLTLTESCYKLPGKFALTIKITSGSAARMAVFYGEGSVTSSSTDSLVDNERTIPSIDELLAQIDAMEKATAAATAAANRAPYIGSNNHWFIWDNAAGAYVDAGISAAGSGVASVNGIKPNPQGDVIVNLGEARFLLARNYTDNGYFPAAFVVNKRGQETYTASSAYCIDRWVLRRTVSSLAFVEKGLRLIVNGTTTNHDGLFQSYDCIKQLVGRPVTLAMKILQNDVGRAYMSVSNAVANNVWGNSIASATVNGTGIFVLNCTIPAEADLANPLINIFFGVPSGTTGENASVIFEWAALLDGTYTADMLATFCPEGKAHEDLECSRYFRRIGDMTHPTVIGYASTIGSSETLRKMVQIHVPLPVCMRADPTPVYASAGLIHIGDAYVTVVKGAFAYEGGVVIRADLNAAIDAGVYPVRFNAGGYIDLSADL